MVFQCIHQTRSSITYQMPTLFSKEYMIFGSHPDNFSLWMRPTRPSKNVIQVIQIVRVIRPTFNPDWDASCFLFSLLTTSLASALYPSFPSTCRKTTNWQRLPSTTGSGCNSLRWQKLRGTSFYLQGKLSGLKKINLLGTGGKSLRPIWGCPIWLLFDQQSQCFFGDLC